MSTIQANSVVGAEGGSLKQFITRPFQNWFTNRVAFENRFSQTDSHVNFYPPYTQQTAGGTSYGLYTYTYSWAPGRTYNLWYYCDTDAVVSVDTSSAASYCYATMRITTDSTFANYLLTSNNTYAPYGNMSSTMYLVPAGHWYYVENNYGNVPAINEWRISLNDDVITSGSPF